MISQRSVGKLQRLMTRLIDSAPSTLPLLAWNEYRTRVYEEGVDPQVLLHIEHSYNKRPMYFLPALHDGTISAHVYHRQHPSRTEEDVARGQDLLKVFCEVALRRGLQMPAHLQSVKDLALELLASLEIDGYEFVGDRLVPSTMKGINLDVEDDYLIQLVRTIGPPNVDVILHHHNEADDTFVNGNWGSASAETRNFFIALLRGLRDVATGHNNIPPFKHGNDKGEIEDLQKHGLLTAEEKEAILRLWVLLSYSGSHVGIQDKDRARLTRLLVLGQSQWLCLKFIEWTENGFRPFQVGP